MTKTVWVSTRDGPRHYDLPEESAAALEAAQAMVESMEEFEEEGEEASLDTLFEEGLLPVPPDIFADMLAAGEIEIIPVGDNNIPVAADLAQYFTP